MNEAAPKTARRSARTVFFRIFGSAIGSQAMLSAASLAVNLLLIRRTSGEQYGSYILIANGFLLLNSLQSAFFVPTLIMRMTPLDFTARNAFVHSLHHEQEKILKFLFIPVALSIVALGLTNVISAGIATLLMAANIAAPAVMTREYFRSASLVQKRAPDVARTDAVYAALLVGGAALATLTPIPSASAVISMALAAGITAWLIMRAVWPLQRQSRAHETGQLRRMAVVGAWSAAGAGIHWSFSQGYSYVVAATLDVTAVAAIAGTRMLLMPINLMSTGVSSIMLPLVAEWLQHRPAPQVFRRLLLIASGIAGAAACYLLVMWLARDWIYAHVLKKEFVQRDRLLLLWSATSLLMVLRDQTVYILVARGLLKRLSLMTFCSAILSLGLGYWGMRHYGVAGALFGVLCGEASNVTGVVVATAFDVMRNRHVSKQEPETTAFGSALQESPASAENG